MIAPYYEGHGITLYLGDCLALMPCLPTIADMVLADPPYGTTRNQWDKELPNKLLFHGLRQLARPRAAVCIFGTGMFSARLMVDNASEYRYSLVWDKEAVSGFLNSNKQPLRCHEDVNVFYRGQPVYHPQMVLTGKKSHGRGAKRDRTINHYGGFANTDVVEQDGYQFPRSIVTFKRPKLPKGVGHPSQKPVALCEWLIRTYTDEGQVVLDNVAGSGTTLIAARNTGRQAVGIEIREEYCEMIAKRIESGSEGDRW